MIYHDHRTVPSCACVEHRLRSAVEMFDRARELSAEALAHEEPHDGLKLAAQAAQLRLDGADEVREALRAIQEPPPHADLSPEQLAARRPEPQAA